ncbi:MAG: PHP domain-containing protein [Clostridia bacterium]|nr:PHP domain-containing protein [Clostridia bacterium]
MKTYCDLHTHSAYSDGTWMPAELIAEAEKIGLSAIALTDHNTVAGLPEFFRAAQGKNVEAIGGVELSTDYGEVELHIVGLFIQEKHFDEVTKVVTELTQRKEASNRKLCDDLRQGGYDVDLDEIKAKTPRGHINRAHIASALVEKGYVQSIGEAFATLLSKNGGFYNQPKRLDVFETIAWLDKIGCVSVLAHPFEELDEAALRVFLQKAKQYGLHGMETEYAKYNIETVQKLKEIAKEFHLKESGGSDFHGDRRKGTYLGIGQGNLRVPHQFMESLRAERKEG